MSNNKLREALASIKALVDDEPNGTPWIDTIKSTIDAALSAPIRNCDVGTAEEQSNRYNEFCRKNYGCYINDPDLVLEWAQLPYEKGEDDEQ